MRLNKKSFLILFISYRKINNMLNVYLNKHLKNNFIESEIDSKDMLYKHRKRFHHVFHFCHFSRNIHLSFDHYRSTKTSIIWLFDDNFAFINIIRMQHTANFARNKWRIQATSKHIVRRKLQFVQIIRLHEQQISQLQIFI